MKQKTLAILCVLALLIALPAFSHPDGQVQVSKGFSAIPLRHQVAADLKTQGKSSPEITRGSLLGHRFRLMTEPPSG